ncbi:MAG TPA: Ivy family c-type lysozyme inhibitor [Chromobacteriaceae bacterium]|nr:Ivy family c-type lysozyme inhibitor [Chromobacteriaceae bacterium]
MTRQHRLGLCTLITAALLAPLSAQAASAKATQALNCQVPSAANGYRGNCPYLSDVLKGDKTFRTAFKKTLRANQVPELAGPEGPMSPVNVGSQVYISGNRCEAHNCGSHNYVIIYSPTTQRLAGIYQPDGSNPMWFGQPNGDEQAALRQLFGQ